MKSAFYRVFSSLILLAAAAPAGAQQIQSPYRFLDTSQEAGFFVAQLSPAEGALGLGPESGPVFGARYAIVLSGPFMIEVEGSYFPTSHAVLDTVVVDSAYRRIGSADHDLIIATAALRINLTGQRTWHRLQPFLAFGIGGVAEVGSDDAAVNQAPVDARYEFGTSFAGILAGGIAWVPADRFAVRLDARNLLWKVKTPAALLRGDTGKVIPADEWLQNVGFSAGVSIFF